jgi:hypothetical protein
MKFVLKTHPDKQRNKTEKEIEQLREQFEEVQACREFLDKINKMKK